MAYEFFRQIRASIVFEGRGCLPDKVRELLASSWVPTDDTQKQTLYYIAGAMLRIVGNMSEKCKDDYKPVMMEIFQNAKHASQQDAKAESLPVQRVASQNKDDKFLYVNEQFYNIILRIESVFSTLLKVKNIEMYGAEIVKDVAFVLSKEDIGFKVLAPSSPDGCPNLQEFVRRFLRSYGNLCGKDFVRKYNARKGAVSHETLRATLGVIGGKSGQKEGNTKRGADTTTTTVEQSENSSQQQSSEKEKRISLRRKHFASKYVSELRSACTQRGLKKGGKKAELIERIVEYEDNLAEERRANAPVSQHPPVEDWTDAAMLAHLDTVLNDEELQDYIFHEDLQVYYEEQLDNDD